MAFSPQSKREKAVNRLNPEKQALAVAMLADGASIRSTERVTRIHRDTLCRLLVRVGENCQKLMDERFQGLVFNALELDEIWGYVAKKQRHVKPDDPTTFGDAYCFIAQCPQTKVVPCFMLGKRTFETTDRFMAKLAGRVNHDLQLSTDAWGPYRQTIAESFGPEADYMMVVKKYAQDAANERTYGPPRCVGIDHVWVQGSPTPSLTSTSHVEAQNVGLRMAVRRLSRLTLCFSKRFENLLAALRLHFAEFNFVRKHRTLGTAPAVAAGLVSRPWTIRDLLPT